MPQEVCNIGDLDGNGASDIIVKGVIHSYVVFFNADYSIKSSGLSLFNEDVSTEIFSGPGYQIIAAIPDINIDGTKKVLEASIANGGIKKFIFASSSSVSELMGLV